MIPKIRINDDPILKKRCDIVETDEDVKTLVDLMYKTMFLNKGIGLAAPQIGVLKRVIVISTNFITQEFINPEIVKVMGGRSTSNEGCLSFPNKRAYVSRYRTILIKGYDREWKPIEFKLKGISAYCAQHEVDHLNGVTIIK